MLKDTCCCTESPTPPASAIQSARVYRDSVQSIPNNASTAVIFSTSRWDDAGFWVIGSPTRFTLPADGTYEISGHLAYASNPTGQRWIEIRANGTRLLALSQVPSGNASGNPTVLSVSTLYRGLAGEYIELVAYQLSTIALNIGPSDGVNVWHAADFSIMRVS